MTKLVKQGKCIKFIDKEGGESFLPLSCVINDIVTYVFGDYKHKEFEEYEGALDPKFQDLVCCTESFECAKDYMSKEELDDICKMIYAMSIILAPDIKDELKRLNY